MPSFDAVFLFAFRIKQIIIGPVVKQYGPFRLHHQSYILKSGRILNSSRYFVVVGELAETLILNFGTRRDNPSGYAYIVKDRQGPFSDCVDAGEIAIRKSTYRDLYDYEDWWLTHQQTVIECYMEELAAASNPLTGNSRREEGYRALVTKMQAAHQIVSDAFREFKLEYSDVAVGTKRNAAKRARDARQARKKASQAIWLINKLVK